LFKLLRLFVTSHTYFLLARKTQKMIGKDISKAAAIIQSEGLVAFPTETVYGLGANALSPIAVAKIFAAKERPNFDPLIVHIANVSQVEELTSEANPKIYPLIEKFWPGPLTLVLPKSTQVPDLVTSGLSTVGIRMPNNDIALELIKQSQCPIAAPSANKFGQLSPVDAHHVAKQLSDIDYILDGGQTSVGVESTIVSIEGDVCRLLRPGFISLEDIEEALPGLFKFETLAPKHVLAPGLLKSHYSPQKPLYFIEDIKGELPEGSGLICHGKSDRHYATEHLIYTSEHFDKIEIAANLFSSLHKMEEDKAVKQIFIEKVDEEGIGLAIMDRLQKAAFRYQH